MGFFSKAKRKLCVISHAQVKTRIANEKYLRSHPEVEMLLSDFLRSVFMFYVHQDHVTFFLIFIHSLSLTLSLFNRDVFLKRPTDIREFAAGKLI